MKYKIITLLTELLADQEESEVVIYEESNRSSSNADSVHSVCDVGSNKRVDSIRR